MTVSFSLAGVCIAVQIISDHGLSESRMVAADKRCKANSAAKISL
jgi:hypothetical protein